MTNSRKPTSQQIIPLMVALFAVILLLLVVNGGMCERYSAKMHRRDLQKHYIDSMRTEEQRKKL